MVGNVTAARAGIKGLETSIYNSKGFLSFSQYIYLLYQAVCSQLIDEVEDFIEFLNCTAENQIGL